MLYLSEIRTVNIKSHKDIHIVFPATGIVRFKGSNNDGKSVIPDALIPIISCSLHIKNIRVPLVNYDADEGYVTLKRNDGAILHVTINKESSKTFYRLKLPGMTDVITRYIADKGLRELVTMFGFHWDEKREMSLNIYQTYTPLLCVTTSESYNYDIITSVITDKVAEDSKALIEERKKEFDAGLKAIYGRIAEINASIAGMKFYDEEELAGKSLEFRNLAKLITNLATHDVPDLKVIPDISRIDNLDTEAVWECLNSFQPLEVRGLKDIELLSDIKPMTCARESIEYYLRAKDAYEKGVCFACGRRYTRGRKQSNENTRHALEGH